MSDDDERSVDATRAVTVARLAPVVAHDAGNALGAARLRLQVLARELGAGGGGQTHLEAIRRVLDEAYASLEPMRWLAAPRVPTTPQVASFADALEAALRLARSALRVSGSSEAFDVTVDPSVASAPRVLAGAHALLGIATDLLVCAAFTTTGPARVEVTAARKQDALEVLLRVNGSGDAFFPAARACDARLQAFGGGADASRDADATTVTLRLVVAALA